jgi:hypothetical protein
MYVGKQCIAKSGTGCSWGTNACLDVIDQLFPLMMIIKRTVDIMKTRAGMKLHWGQRVKE